MFSNRKRKKGGVTMAKAIEATKPAETKKKSGKKTASEKGAADADKK